MTMNTINANEWKKNGWNEVEMNFIPEFKIIEKNTGINDADGIRNVIKYYDDVRKEVGYEKFAVEVIYDNGVNAVDKIDYNTMSLFRVEEVIMFVRMYITAGFAKLEIHL